MSRVEVEAKRPKHDVKVPRLRCRILALSAFVSIHEIFLKEYPMAQVYLSDFISSNESLPFNFENQFKRFSYITIFPNQANSSSGKNENGVETNWFQLTANFKVTYDSIDENGQVLKDENATVKTLIVKFPNEYLQNLKISPASLRVFFNDYFVGKRFVTFPVTEETPVFEYKNGTRNLVKNQSQVKIDENFDLLEFMDYIKKQALPKEPVKSK